MVSRLLTLLVLASCATVPVRPGPLRCVTTCGMMADLDETDCARLQDTEVKILAAYAKVPAFVSADFVCIAIAGYTVEVHQRHFRDTRWGLCTPPSWLSQSSGRCVLGQTFQETKTLQIEQLDFATSSLTHEVGHVLDFWFNLPLTHKHCAWTARGTKGAILEVTGEYDHTAESCSPRLTNN